MTVNLILTLPQAELLLESAKSMYDCDSGQPEYAPENAVENWTQIIKLLETGIRTSRKQSKSQLRRQK